MKKAILEIVKTKRFLLMTGIMTLMFLESGLYEWIGGPIGPFRNTNGFYDIIMRVGPIFSRYSPSKQAVYETFFSQYGACTDAAAQLARRVIDCLGSDFYIFSFLIGAFFVPDSTLGKSKNSRDLSPRTLCRKYFAAVFLTMLFLAALNVVPFLVSFRMEKIGLAGSPMSFWYYLITWILPTVMALYAIQLLAGIISESWIVTIFVHFILFFMNSPTVSSYPFYKFIIRFHFGTEEFYFDMRNQIIFNRIFVSVLSILLLGLALWIARRKRGRVNQ